MNAFCRQFTLALGEAKDGTLFAQLQGKGQAQCRCLRYLGACKRLFAIDHQCAGGQVAQAFEVGMLQATDRAEKVAEGQHVDKPQQVADQ